MIKFYKTKDPHGYMSNYYKAQFFVYDRWWPTVEHAYQAQKCANPEDSDIIWKTPKAKDAHLFGQSVKMREHWDTILKEKVMYDCVLAKFLQHSNLRDQLIATGDEEIVEDTSVYNDMYWGCGTDGAGQNKLGKILMKIRNYLKDE